MLLLVFGAVFQTGSNTYNVYIQNQDVNASGMPSSISSSLIKALNITHVLADHVISPETDSVQYLRSHQTVFGDRTRVLLIPPGFQAALINGSLKAKLIITHGTLSQLANSSQNTQGRYGNITQGLAALDQAISGIPNQNASLVYFSEPDDTGRLVVRGIIASVVDSFNYQLVGTQPLVSFSAQNVAVKGLSSVDYYLPGVTSAFIMTNGVIGLTSIASEFKRRGLIKRLSATPLRRIDWIVGNVLSQTILALLLTAFMIVIGRAVFGVTVTLDALSVAIVLAGALMFSGIGMLLAGLVKDPEAANGVGNAIAFPMMFLSGTYFPLDLSPQYIQQISRALPLTYFTNGLRGSMILNDTSTALFDLLVLLVLAALFIAVGSFATRWKEK